MLPFLCAIFVIRTYYHTSLYKYVHTFYITYHTSLFLQLARTKETSGPSRLQRGDLEEDSGLASVDPNRLEWSTAQPIALLVRWVVPKPDLCFYTKSAGMPPSAEAPKCRNSLGAGASTCRNPLSAGIPEEEESPSAGMF